ncbi:hypothetical protein DM860_005411 [Cuscuta australis]|uniref:TIR domain-containing protein n=1 Tax=Cuscuta australis TaxID=267555 RepID=A0A328DZ91_9ASTE|nr:hypothetical protein DM860_005411 [Cuscuta australis]
MDLREESLRFEPPVPTLTLRNPSSSSSAFFSANQSPFISPRSPKGPLLPPTNPSTHSTVLLPVPAAPGTVLENAQLSANSCPVTIHNNNNVNPQKVDIGLISSTSISNSPVSTYNVEYECEERTRRRQRGGKQPKMDSAYETCVTPTSTSSLSSRVRSCDVYIGFHGRKPLLSRFTNWLRAELEVQGVSCFVTDRARCRSSRKHGMIARVMDASAFGVVILTRKSFRNPFTIHELQFFSSKKVLVPIYFDLRPDECLVRDIIERRGELWEKHGGELWVHYGGPEKEWRDSVNALSRVDEWKLEAHDGKWRECILRAVTLLALRLGRRSVVDRLTKWRETSEKEEFPFPRNESFVGRKKELSELEFRLFGDASGDMETRFFELPRRKNLMVFGRSRSRSSSFDENRRKKGKEPMVWKESEKEIEMQNADFACQNVPKTKSARKNGRRKRSMKVVYGKGIACVSGESGIGKTELLLEFAYRLHQRYKMVLWIGGEARFIRQNYLNLWPFLEVDVGVESSPEKGTRAKSFEEQEEAAIARVRKQFMRNIPFLVIIDNLESEKDWWDRKLVMDLLPRFGGETHVIISTRLPHLMNLDPIKLGYLSEIEAMSLMMQGGGNTTNRDYPITEIDALRTIEEKLKRSTLGLSIIGSILSELPINPARLLDTVNRMPSVDIENHPPFGQNVFLLKLFEVCFSIFDHADGGPRSLATRMVLASGWLAPSPAPVSFLASAAHRIPEKHPRQRKWRKLIGALACGLAQKKSQSESSSAMLLRFSVARRCTKEGYLQVHELVRHYARKKGFADRRRVPQATIQTVITHGSIYHQPEHIWAACFQLFGYGCDPMVDELKVTELLYLVKQVVTPLAVRTFVTFSRCSAALELLRRCTDALEAADQAFVTPVEKWLDKSLCWRPIQTNAQLNPCLWQELALARASVLEIRAKLMMKGGQFDVGDDLIRKAIFIRTSICGEDHPDTRVSFPIALIFILAVFIIFLKGLSTCL